MDSIESEEIEIEENIFALARNYEDAESDPDTPPPSPDALRNQNKPGFFSFAQVSLKITELWSSAHKKVFGEDYWIPTDSYEVVEFPSELLPAHKVVYPMNLNEKSKPMLKVVQGTFKNSPSEPLHHVVFTLKYEQTRIALSIFRSTDLGEAVDFCRRCEDCRILLKTLHNKNDIRKTIREMTNQFQNHPLWRMVHIAIACHRSDVFSDEGLETLKENGYSLNEITNTVSTPEGKYPLMIAIETLQPDIVTFLLKNGADPAARDMKGNNSLHYAALASVQMIEIIWEDPRTKPLLNSINDDRDTPVFLAIRNANVLILRCLMGLGAELSLRSTGRNPLFEAMQSKGKTTEVIRQLLAASPNLIYEQDQSGNTVLHAAMYKTSLMGLLYLQARHLDLNVRNKAGQTPLHVYTSRDDLGMVITLVSYGCDLNAANNNGDTPLHIAVSKKYLEISRFLLSVGADPNVVNQHGDSPRHLAAKLNEVHLLKSLIICGAKRCPPIKTGCVSGCVNSRSIQMLSSRASSECGPSPRSFADLEKLENRTFFSVGHGNFIQRYVQDNIYEEMVEKLQKVAEMEEESEEEFINILSMDGGGIRGLVIVQTLIEIEKLIGESIFKYFDWVAGTSTGALVAAGLSQGKTSRDCQKIYLRFKDMVFEGFIRPYNANVLETFMQTEVGNTTMMSDIRWPRLMITTVRADIFPVQLELMRNYRFPVTEDENEKLGCGSPEELPVWKALRRTSAAPTFFANAENKYIDGGIISNNPLLELLTEVDLWNSINKFKGFPKTVKIGCILSIGTGVIPTIPLDTNTLEVNISNPMNIPSAVKALGLVIVDQATATEGAPVARALSWCSTSRTPYFRLSSPLFKDIAMDNTNDHDLARMMWECVEYVYENQAYIDKMVALLRKIGPSHRRKHLFQKPNLKFCDVQTQTSALVTPD